MYTFAFWLLVAAALAAVCGAGSALLTLSAPSAGKGITTGGARRDLRRAELAGLAQGGCLGLASLILLYALASNDFSLVYVAGYTDRVLPMFYRLTAFWAGQAGSFLFWALAVGLSGVLFQFTRAYSGLTPGTRLWYWVFYLSIMAFFGLLLITWHNPFLMYHAAPADGNGLNPLLQNPGMIFHPPLLFLGYGGFVIPGCLALAQTLSGNRGSEESWVRLSRPFSLGAWGLLTAGIVLGGWWAYMELGWGGYWAWDPVENASLIPWLISTAALHTQMLETRRGKLYATNVFFMALTTISAFFATYLVRSGVVQSVHAFGVGGVGAPLLLFILCFTILALYVSMLARRNDAPALEGLESREGFVVLTSWLLLALSAVILVATMWPVFTTFWRETIMGLARETVLDAAGHDHGGAVGLTADFYNRVCLPLFAALAALLVACPWLRWRGGVRNRRFIGLSLATFIGSMAGFWSGGYTSPTALLAMGAAAGVLVSMGLLCSEASVRGNRSSLGACVIHMGVAFMVMGVAFSGPYKTEASLTLAPNQKGTVGKYEVVLNTLQVGKGAGFDFLEAELTVSKNGSTVAVLKPQRRIYAKWNQMQFAEASTSFSLGNELYASLLGVDDQSRARVLVSVNPLVNWIWVGGFLLSVVPFAILRRRESGGPETEGRGEEKLA